MKKILFVAVLLSIISVCQAQTQALFGYSTFYLADQQQPYVETYLQFDAWTMQFDEVSPGSYRAVAEVTIMLSQQDSVCYVKKYDLSSPTVQSLDQLDFSFLDVQRFSVRNGIYDLTLTLRDKGADAPAAVVVEKVVINYEARQPMLSSLQLMAKVSPTQRENILSRNGFDMEPYVNDFLPEQVEQLQYYYEVYNIDSELGDGPFLAMSYIEEQQTGFRVEGTQTVARKNAAQTVPVLGTMDVKELPSGNYNLVVEVRNRDNQTLLYKRLPFYRSNPGVKGKEISEFATTFAGRYKDEDQLNLYLDGLYPIASDAENNVIKDLVRRPALEEKQAFLYRFWQRRNALDPETEWLKYKERIDYVQEHFSYPITNKEVFEKSLEQAMKNSKRYQKLKDSLSYGEIRAIFDEKVEMRVLGRKGKVDTVMSPWDSIVYHKRLVSTPGIHTDRGRVYLQYGPPDFVRDEKNYVSANRIGSNNEQAPVTMQLGNSQQDGSPMYHGTSQGHVFYLPYQLWRYNKLATDDPNRVFLFWDEHRSGYYTLLNSNARGEVQDPGWERRLCRQQLNEGVVGEVGEQFNRGY